MLTNLFGEGYEQYKPEDPEEEQWDKFEDKKTNKIKEDLLFGSDEEEEHKEVRPNAYAFSY